MAGGCLMASLAAGGCAVHPMPPPPPPKAMVVPKPSAALMTRDAAPKCTYTDEEQNIAAPIVQAKAEGDAGNSAESAAANTDNSAALAESLQRRERERDCFRDAEHRVRTKLTKLQTSVRKTLRAVENHQDVASAR